jgi:uncharacterized membrane protein YedE/YeeE
VKLVWKKFDYYDPFWIVFGLWWIVGGGYGLWSMGFRGPSILWLLRAFIILFLAMGVVILIRQFQLRPKRQSSDLDTTGDCGTPDGQVL